MKYLVRDSNSITISQFYELHLLTKFNYDPPCQRKSVWGEEQKSFLIDSLLKNFPIPPIFLYRKIDNETGKETYDVIDGKQRLLSIIDFIENKISLPDDYGDDLFGDERLNGKKFIDLKEEKSIFWKYKLTIEYVESNEIKVIDSVFDRLNRNGVSLNRQELRKSRYNSTKLYKVIEQLKNVDFWLENLKNSVKSDRLEDDEFISDILFYLIDNRIISSTADNLDKLYDKYSDFENDDNLNSVIQKFMELSQNFEKINLDFNKYKIYGVSHLYTLCNVLVYCMNKNINVDILDKKLDNFYKKYRSNDDNENIVKYKNGMARDVKSATRRKLRFIALKSYLQI